jgi:ribosomal protein S19
MSRSLKKLPFVDEKLLKKIEEANKNQIKGSFKT